MAAAAKAASAGVRARFVSGSAEAPVPALPAGGLVFVTRLDDPDLWGGPVTGERYLLVGPR